MPKNPIYFFLYGHHYLGGGGWIPSSEDIEAFLDVLARYQIKGTFFFDGITVSELKKKNTRIFLRINEENHAIGYHGEESHGPYPVLIDYLFDGVRKDDNLLYDLSWDEAINATINRYSNEITYEPPKYGSGQIDLRLGGKTNPDNPGGILLVQELFSRSVDILTSHALEAAPAAVAFGKMTSCRLHQAAPPLVSHYLKIVNKSHLEKEAMKIGGKNNAFLWYMNGLHMKEFAEDDLNALVAYTTEDLYRFINNLSPERLHLISIIMLKNKKSDLKNLDNLIRIISSEFCSKDPDIRFVTAAEIQSFFEPQNDYSLTNDKIKKIAAYLLDNWNNRPPDWVHLLNSDFSLVNAFEALLISLLEFAKFGVMPERVENSELLGPIGEVQKSWHKGTKVVSTPVLFEQLPDIKDQIERNKYQQVPYEWRFGQVVLNTAELLYAMSDVFLSFSQSDEKTTINIPKSQVTPPYADIMEEIFEPEFPNPLWYSKLQLWTVKPAKHLATGQ